MPRKVYLVTGQWADLKLDELFAKLASWGYDGVELACWGEHFDVQRALKEPGYAASVRELLDRHGLECRTLSAHLVGQAVCDDPIDERHKGIVPPHVWGDGDPEGVRQRAAQEMIDTAKAASRLGIQTVVGFTGSKIWHTLAGFPPVPPEMIEDGYADFAARWSPIIDAYEAQGVRFALEVHPSEIAYDYWTTKRTLEAIGDRPGFGINFDPSHFMWQFLDPIAFLREFAPKIYNVHCKESTRNLDGRNGVIASHLGFGDWRRGWDFVSVGHGIVPWEKIFRTLNDIGYDGALAVEWEDSGMDRETGAPESLAFLRPLLFDPSGRAFDAAFSSS